MTSELDLARLVTVHQTMVWRYLRFLGCDRHEADDLTQETFLALIAAGFDERNPAATAAYLRKAARSRFLMRARKNGRPRLALDVAELGERAEAAFERNAGADGGERYLDALRECLPVLDQRMRAALDMRYRDEAARSDIAAALGVGDEGAKSLLMRGKELLRACIEKRLRVWATAAR